VRRTKTERSSALNLDQRSRSPLRFSDWILHRRGQGVTSVFHRGVKGAGAVAPDEPTRVSCHIVSGEEASHHPEQLFAVGYAACFEGALGVVARRERLKAGAGSRDQFQKRLKIFGTVTAIFNKETSGNADVDLHGETVLTDEDTRFIRPKGHEATAPWAPSDCRFFDAVQP
jgi:hypothetical protein